MLTRTARAFIAFGCLVFHTAAISAQQAESRSREGSLRIAVLDESKNPVIEAEVSVADSRRRRTLRTDSTGNILFESLMVGTATVEIRRIGFKPASVVSRIGVGDNAVTVHLRGATAELDAVRIVANRPISARLDDYEIRLARGEANAVITREEIDKRNPIVLSQLLRRLPGIKIQDSSGSIVAVSMRGQKLTRTPNGQMAMVQCVLRVMVDGTVMPALTSLDNIIPREIHGVELFLGGARVPLQLAGTRTDNWCGVIAIWTRDGG